MDILELQKAYAEAAKSIGISGDKAHSAFAETIVQLVQPNHVTLDVLSSFFPTERLNPGDNLMRRVRKGKYKVHSMVPGSMHLHSNVSYQDQYAFMFDRLTAGVTHSLWEIKSGDIGTVEEMRAELEADIIDVLVGKVFELLGTLWSSSLTPNNYADASSGGLTATILDAMMENVIDEAGTVQAIVGTRRALLNVYSFSGYKEYALSGTGTDAVGLPINSRLEERRNTGRVKVYNGAPLIELPNIRKGYLPGVTRKLLDTSKVLVIGADAGMAALMGGFETQDYTDFRTQPANYVLDGWQAYSMLVDMPEMIGVIKVAPTST